MGLGARRAGLGMHMCALCSDLNILTEGCRGPGGQVRWGRMLWAKYPACRVPCIPSALGKVMPKVIPCITYIMPKVIPCMPGPLYTKCSGEGCGGPGPR